MIWQACNGRTLNIKDMNKQHILNTLRWLKKTKHRIEYPDGENPEIVERKCNGKTVSYWQSIFNRELQRREKEKDNFYKQSYGGQVTKFNIQTISTGTTLADGSIEVNYPRQNVKSITFGGDNIKLILK